MATLWSVHAFGVIPIGSICLVLLLSDIRSLQKIAMSLCSVRIAFGALRMTLSSIFALFAVAVFVVQCIAVFAPTNNGQLPNMTVEMADRIRMKEWRNDRNWWISLFAFTVWVIVWRLQVWTQRYCLAPHPEEPPVAKKAPAEKKKD